MSIKDRRPSPALFVAIIALVAALGGTAVALPGKGSVDKNDLAKNVVKSKNIAKGAVKSSDIKDNGVKGVDIDESSLSQVPSAASATNAANADAVGGTRVVAINAFIPDGSAANILNVGGLTIAASCAANSTLESLDATTTASDAFLLSSSERPGSEDIVNGVSDDTFASGDTIDLIPDDADEVHTTTYFDDGTGAAGAQIRAQYTIGQDDGSVDGATGCYAIGTAEVL